MAKRTVEAIVIGSGATGGVAALTLAELGVKVLVIEAGPNLSPNSAMGSEPANSFRRITNLLSEKHKIQAQHPGYWKSNPLLYANEKENQYTYPKDHPFYWTQGRQVGGKSLTWGGITLRLSDNEFKASQKDGYGPEWPISYSDLERHYSFLEKNLKVHGQKDGIDQLPDGEYIEPFPFTDSEKEFASSVNSTLGYKVIHSRGFGAHKSSIDGEWPKSSSLGSTLKKALKTGNVEILSNHMVERFNMNSNKEKATGVTLINMENGVRSEIDGDLIVICSSTIQTLRLLLNSQDSQCENGFVEPSGELGCYLMDHVSTCRFFSFPQPNTPSQKTTNELQSLSGAGSFLIPIGSQTREVFSNNFIRGYGLWGGIERFEPPRCLKRKPKTTTGFLIGHGEVLPVKSNRVTLSRKVDRWGYQIPHIDFYWRENERAMIENIQKTIKKIITAAGGEILPLTDLVKMPFIEPIVKGAVALRDSAPPPGYYIHEVGGARMGNNEEESVVDPWNRLWRCPNVLVVDGACWPTSGWQSPTLTMMAITRRACQEAVKPLND